MMYNIDELIEIEIDEITIYLPKPRWIELRDKINIMLSGDLDDGEDEQSCYFHTDWIISN